MPDLRYTVQAFHDVKKQGDQGWDIEPLAEARFTGCVCQR